MVLPPSTSQMCGVCGESADSVHFGGLSCRACAAFFRRKVAGNQVTVRRCAGECNLTNQVLRRLCASCRYEKCLKIGMKTSAVLSRLPIKSDHSRTSSEPPITLLEQLQEAYENLVEARKAAYKIEEDYVPQQTNYKQMNHACHTDLNLIMETIIPFFRNQMDTGEDQHKFLLSHFIIPFVLFESAFRSMKSDLLLLPNGDYVDDEQLERYYQNPDDEDDSRAKQATILLEPYWKLNKKALREHLKQVQLELPEFLFLTALIYWDFGFQNQSDECIEKCKQQRSKIFEELSSYEKSVRKNEDHCMRVGEILMVLYAVQKAFNIMRESREISMIYNLYETHCPMFELMRT